MLNLHLNYHFGHPQEVIPNDSTYYQGKDANYGLTTSDPWYFEFGRNGFTYTYRFINDIKTKITNIYNKIKNEVNRIKKSIKGKQLEK